MLLRHQDTAVITAAGFAIFAAIASYQWTSSDEILAQNVTEKLESVDLIHRHEATNTTASTGADITPVTVPQSAVAELQSREKMAVLEHGELQEPVAEDVEYLTLPDQKPDRTHFARELDTKLNMEEYDVEWATLAENETWEAFYSVDLPHSDLRSVRCKKTLCKIEISHVDRSAENQFYQALLAKLNGHRGHLEQYANDNGERITEIYRFR